MQIDCTRQRVMITGAASGMGAVTARAFADAGARVWICDRFRRGRSLRRGNPDIGCYVTDVTDARQISSFFEAAQRDLGGLDSFINNAGYSGPTAPVETSRPRRSTSCWQLTCARSSSACVTR